MRNRLKNKALLKIEYNYNYKAYKLSKLNIKIDKLLMNSNNTIKIDKLQNKANKLILNISSQWN